MKNNYFEIKINFNEKMVDYVKYNIILPFTISRYDVFECLDNETEKHEKYIVICLESRQTNKNRICLFSKNTIKEYFETNNLYLIKNMIEEEIKNII